MTDESSTASMSFLRRLWAHWSQTYGVWLLALFAALGAAWAAHLHIQAKERDLQHRNQVVMVTRLVAWADLEAGQLLTEDDIASREIPKNWAPHQSLSPEQTGLLIGSRLKVPVMAGQPILQADIEFVSPGTAARLGVGKRALTLPVRELADMPPDMREGDRLDIYVSLTHHDKRLTLPLLQNGKVLAAPGPESAQVVLEADAQDVTRVIAARQAGSLTLALRSPEDAAYPAHDEPGGALADILGLAEEGDAGVPVLYGDESNDVPTLEAQ
ncbi:Flp pilus assembly protein CpaB [Bordetella avium]|uniref:Flp pilus assembly protein CpaB n=1 Tax=Bordetella avium TaxID=521 RepID=UPI000E12F944|nr:Flp pilus assembly protein CpaB [Bordetella avium]WQE34763.1 Flp pilus assembly protein CpaB [Bordetella avium]SUV68406.1 pilus assembly protein [Bordetella avium]